MLTLQTRDSKKHNRTIVIESGFVKPSGIRCAKVRNDQGKVYFVQVKPDRIGACTCESRKPCYHMQAVLATHLPAYADLAAPTPLEKRIGTISRTLAVEIIEQYAMECDDMYSKLAETKHIEQPDTYRYCGHICRGDMCGTCAA